jgi:hypothetical protein
MARLCFKPKPKISLGKVAGPALTSSAEPDCVKINVKIWVRVCVGVPEYCILNFCITLGNITGITQFQKAFFHDQFTATVLVLILGVVYGYGCEYH